MFNLEALVLCSRQSTMYVPKENYSFLISYLFKFLKCPDNQRQWLGLCPTLPFTWLRGTWYFAALQGILGILVSLDGKLLGRACTDKFFFFLTWSECCLQFSVVFCLFVCFFNCLRHPTSSKKLLAIYCIRHGE